MNATTTEYGLIFDNFKAFAEERPEQAKELLNHVEKDDWMDDKIYFYAFPEDYANYQVCEGWYAAILNCDLSVANYNSAPSLYDYIDFEELGKKLAFTADPTCVFSTSKDEIIETCTGWSRKQLERYKQ